MHEVKINELALELVKKLIDNKETYDIEVIELSSGATVIDCTNT